MAILNSPMYIATINIALHLNCNIQSSYTQLTCAIHNDIPTMQGHLLISIDALKNCRVLKIAEGSTYCLFVVPTTINISGSAVYHNRYKDAFGILYPVF